MGTAIRTTMPNDTPRSTRGVVHFLREVRRLTREELLAIARRAYEAHPDTGSPDGDDPLLTFLLGQIDKDYDPSRPVESAKDALQQVVLGVFVMLNALYPL